MPIADALKAAHRLGLPHGRLGSRSRAVGRPDRTQARLHRSSGRLPGEPEPMAATDDAHGAANRNRDGATPAADLYSLGVFWPGCCRAKTIELIQRSPEGVLRPPRPWKTWSATCSPTIHPSGRPPAKFKTGSTSC